MKTQILALSKVQLIGHVDFLCMYQWLSKRIWCSADYTGLEFVASWSLLYIGSVLGAATKPEGKKR